MERKGWAETQVGFKGRDKEQKVKYLPTKYLWRQPIGDILLGCIRPKHAAYYEF